MGRTRLEFAGPDPWTAGVVVGIALGLASGCSGKPVPGDPARFDPVAMTETMRAEAGENFGLVQWEATGVRPDGTIDLTDEVVDGTVNYRFERALEPPADQPPLGAGGSMEAVWHDEARVRIRRAGWHHTGTRQDAGGRTVQSYDRTRGLEVRRYDPQPGAPAAAAAPPTCSLAILWEAALAEGAPQAAVARIHYDRQGYEFWISGTDVRLGFTPECELR